jgi:hypothetical protein
MPSGALAKGGCPEAAPDGLRLSQFHVFQTFDRDPAMLVLCWLQRERLAMEYNFLEWMELLSYVATVIGIPMALVTYMYDNYKERQSEQGEIYDDLMAHYAGIQNKLFDYPELDQHDKPLPDLENQRRQRILYEMLVSLFERAFIMLYVIWREQSGI